MNVVDHHKCARIVRGGADGCREPVANIGSPFGRCTGGLDHPVDPDPADRKRKLGELIEVRGRSDNCSIATPKRNDLTNELIQKTLGDLLSGPERMADGEIERDDLLMLMEQAV